MSDEKAPAGSEAAPSKRTLLIAIGAAAATAVVITLAAILPAEYNKDPLGLGRLTGLSRLWAPEAVVAGPDPSGSPAAIRQPAGFRTDTFEIPLAADGDATRRNALEFKVRLRKGGSLVYSWQTEGLAVPEDLMFDFHGHTVAEDAKGGPVSVADYEKGSGATANGSLVAPIEGIHGWYFRNRSAQPIRVRVRLSGFYQLVPSGQEGNLAGIQPVIAARPTAGP